MTIVGSPITALVRDDNAKVIGVGGARYETASRMLHGHGESQMLEPRIGDLLMELIRANGPVTREALLDKVWGVEGSDEALTQAISKLRRALGDTVRPHRIVQTVPKEGYRLGVSPDFNTTQSVDAVALQPLKTRVVGLAVRHRVFLSGFVAGIIVSIIGLAILTIFNPPRQVETEIICPANIDPEACAALTD
ncbi:MAG: hypothetical protein GXP06_03695 [Alphaproteobacteria bacterium]|nr:hypothetical protein [Alphaproteobacteria bacterium]